ncbi:MAG: amidohydrolase family protein [bacterium]|nr:MAG: amidohydrolase family protein [bacterium]
MKNIITLLKNNYISPILLFTISIFIGCTEQSSQKITEKIFINGHIITMDDISPEAEAMAIGNGKIVDIGTSEKMKNDFPEADIVDFQGKTVMPGIIESHGHLLSLGQSFLELNLEGIATPEQVVIKVKERASETQPGEWIIGWGWDEGAWAKNYPENQGLNDASPDNPVYLRGLHGFASWVNNNALEIAGITADTPDPPNGEILKDSSTGRPTGILTNKAQPLVEKYIPPLTSDQIERALQLAIEECLTYGLTTIHEAKTSAIMLQAFRSLKGQNKLKTRIYVMLDVTEQGLIEPFLNKGAEIDEENLLTIRCLKVFVDGALGSRGAAMIEPYSDAPDVKGVIVTMDDSLYQLTVRALKSGFQVATHAIGDLANRITLNAYRRAIEQVPSAKDHRLRLEHAQVTALEDIPKFAPLNIVLSMQPPHCTSDMPWAETRVGSERIKGAYAWRSFLNTGVHLTLNSDFPGETLNPFYGMYAAETRQTLDGKPEGGWYPEQCLTREEVLKGYTVKAAYAGFEENIKGKLIPGMLADFIVLSDDILKISSKELLSLRIEKTYLGGELVYERTKELDRLPDLPEGAQAISLLGDTLYIPVLSDDVREKYQKNLIEAKAAYDANSNDVDAIIWLGRRAAYLGEYRTAIDIYSGGIKKYPNEPRLYRHRGHRFITVRQLTYAISDFERAASLIKGTEDKIEPDGLPNTRNIPTSTLHFNIWYHLGLAYYLQGKSEIALSAYQQCMKVSTNPDALAATSHWLYMTLRRLGKDEQAAQVLEPINAEMDIIENQSYHQLLLFYKGEISQDSLMCKSADALDNATIGYGVGNWHFYNGNQDEAKQIFQKVIQGTQWAAFGYIAAEADLSKDGI